MQSTRFFLAATLLAAVPCASLHAQSAAGQARRDDRSAQLEARIERLRREIETLARRRLDAERLQSEEISDSVRRELDPQIGRAARELAAIEALLARQNLESQLRGSDAGRMAAASEWRAQWEAQSTPALSSGTGVRQQQQPSGWVGVSFSGPTQTWYGRNGLVMFNGGFPVVESVEPGSPAERAGLQAGDTVIAFDGRDIRRREIPLAKQLRPGVRLVVRVRRDGGTRDVPVMIERRPMTFVPSFAVITPEAPRALIAPPAPLARARARTPRPGDAPMTVGAAPVYPATPEAPSVPAGVPAPAPTPVAPPISWVFTSGGPPAVAGAELAAISAGLREVFGVQGGVLVLNVAAGSPAASSGLRAGDVVVRVNGAAVTTPSGFGRAVQQCRDRSARLDVVRKKRDQKVTLRW